MAKKKMSPPPPPPEPTRAQLSVINLKGSPEYIAWLDGAHRKTRISKAALFRIGMEMVAKAYELDPPPEM